MTPPSAIARHASASPQGSASLPTVVLLAVIAACVVLLAGLASVWRPLWYDELFTYHVARQPSLLSTVRALLIGADTNPPLDYLLRHGSMALFGESAWAFRLPSALAFVTGLFAIYGFVRPRVPRAAAVAAFVAPIGTAAVYFSYEGRAYALLFASGALALLAWQRATERATAGRLLLLTLALCLGPFSHYYGVLSLVPPAVGEGWRSIARRRIDWAIAIAFGAAGLLCLLLWPFARQAMGMKSAFWASAFGLADAYQYFTAFLQYAGSPVIVGLAVAAALVIALAASPRTRSRLRADVPMHEVLAVITLAYVPLLAYLLGHFATGALTARYAIGFVPGAAMLLGYALAMLQRPLGKFVFLAPIGLAATSLWQLGQAALDFRGEAGFPRELRVVIERSALRVAFDSPHKFLEYAHYAPADLAARFVYPMDAERAVALRGFNNDEIALRRLAQIVPLDVRDYSPFAARTPEFLLVRDYDFASGLVPQLQVDGFCLEPLARYRSVELLRVTWNCSR